MEDDAPVIYGLEFQVGCERAADVPILLPDGTRGLTRACGARDLWVPDLGG